MIYKLIFKLGQHLRNPSMEECSLFLKESESWSLEALEDYQLKKLKEILRFAYAYSPFYRNYFEVHNFSISQIKKIDDIRKVPIVTKRLLLDNTLEIQATYKFKKLFKASTSGSTGEGLEFSRNEEADSFNRAVIFRGYSWYRVYPWDRNAYLWGFNFSLLEKGKTKCLDFLQNRFRIFSYEEKSFAHFVQKLRSAKYFHGYSSMLFQTAKLINERGLVLPKSLKMIKGTSEKIFDSYQEEVKKAFGLKIISEYGATESGIIAFECPEGNMHLNMEGVIVEEVDNEIIVTNLQMKSFPVIRYALGDYIQLAPRDEVCSCGRKHRILKEVIGRIGQNVYGIEGVYPSLYFYYIFKNIAKNSDLLLNYQVVQVRKGELEFRIEQSINEEEIRILRKEIEKYFEKNIRYKVLVGVNLIATKHKFKSFLSNMDS